MLDVALKEWAVVCDALGEGRQIVLLRKGGILEAAGGFELEHRKFLLFPTYVHQNTAMLKPAVAAGVRRHSEEPDRITLSFFGEVSDIIRVESRARIDTLDDLHVWTPPLIDMRFNYRPKNPLYLVLVRAYRLAKPATIDNRPDYAGCKSWVPLEMGIDTTGAVPALDETAWRATRAAVLERMGV